MEVKVLELEEVALEHLDNFIHNHALYFLIGAIFLFLALLAWVLNRASRRKRAQDLSHIRPVIFIDVSGSRQVETLDPLLPSHNPPDYDDDDH